MATLPKAMSLLISSTSSADIWRIMMWTGISTSLLEAGASAIPCARVTLLSAVALLGSSPGVSALLRLLAWSSSGATP